VELRAAGPTFAAIATQLGVSDEAARKAVNRALDAIRAEISQGADRLRAMEAARLDRAAASWRRRWRRGPSRARGLAA
jgi:hypothetical protein